MSSDLELTIAGELGPQGGDHLGRLVDRERGLGDEGDLVGIGDLERVDLVGGFDQDDAVGRLAGRPFDLLVAVVADHHDRVALRRRSGGRRRGPWSPAGRWRRSCAGCGRRRCRGPRGRRRGRRRRPSRPPAPRSPARRRSRRAWPAPRPRACCGRSPCARRRGRRAARGRARPSARRGRRRRSSRAGRRAEPAWERRWRWLPYLQGSGGEVAAAGRAGPQARVEASLAG